MTSTTGLRAPARTGSTIVAAVFAIWSLWPTLLPRGWVIQAAVTALSAALGWLVGSVLDRVIVRVLDQAEIEVDAGLRRRVLVGLAVVGGVVALAAIRQWSIWQNAQRTEMGMATISSWWIVPALVVAVVLLAVLLVVGRLVVAGVAGIDRGVARIVPSAWARLASVAVLAVAAIIGANLVGDRFVRWADDSFGLVNEGTADGVAAPTSELASGGPGSLVEWDDLGLQGRSFTAGATTTTELVAFGVDDPVEPIRAYAGIDSAATIDERTQLVLAELDRTGGFDREVLVVATATGTGWINPVAARSIEVMYGGDTAIASLQYSFFPSWVAFLIDTAGASVGGIALFDAVHERWVAMDPDDRPLLLVYGESLGSFGAEAAFDAGALDASFTAMAERADGVLLVGPTAGNPVYGRLVDERDPGSPSWRPERASSPTVRTAITVDDIDADDASWAAPRTLYLHWPTDAVGTWAPSSLWRAPGWTRETDAPGIVGATRWFPIVTWVQETADLMAGFSAVPGFGHDYTNALAAAWAAVAPPVGWTDDDTRRLEALLADG